MPGTIIVSVREFKGLHSLASSTPPKMSIKVSMGKREYQTWEKDDFSFPLTSLRDNLMVSLLDAKGNKISDTGVETRLVVEKGLWDHHIFSLEGGGQVHLRFQFVLTEEERYRIRLMRELALGKKHGERSNSCPTSPRTVASNADSSSFLNKEIDTSRISQPPDSVEEIEAQTPHDNVSVTAISSEEASSSSESSELIVAAKNMFIAQNLGVAGINTLEKQIPTGKSPSNVKNMISSFESSLSQEKRPYRKPLPAKSQLRKISSEASLKSSSVDEFKAEKTKPTKMMPGKIKNPFLSRESQPVTTYATTSGDQLDDFKAFDRVLTHQGTKQFELRATDDRTKGSIADVDKKISAKAFDIKKGKKYSESLMRDSTGNSATVSRGVLDEIIVRQHADRSLVNKQHSGGKLSVNDSMKGDHPNYSLAVDITQASTNKLKSKEHWKDKHYSSKCPGTWMFPTESRSVCITAGGKHLMDLMEICHAGPGIHQGENGSAAKIMEKGSVLRGCNKVNEAKKCIKEPRKPKLVNPPNDETSGGLFGQVTKVAIMTGFAILVLLTRQRNNR